MKFIADLHIHSKYARAVSKDMVLEELDRWAHDKGILVMGTGDFTHPAWLQEIKEKLEPAEPGLFKLKKEFKRPTMRGDLAETRFLLTTEVSSIFSRPSVKLPSTSSGASGTSPSTQLGTSNRRVYRVHNLIFAPDIETVEKISTQLGWIGNLSSDGRPILGLDARELAKIVFSASQKAVVVPSHIWTPWFSVFGSMSGFDSLEDCFGEYTKYIFAAETGLSSDPAMNWRLSKLDNIALISNSDSHSLQRIGREANIFDTELSYDGIINAIKSGVPNSRRIRSDSRDIREFVATIEFFPEEGKYHLDGHRLCGIVLEPKETEKYKGVCPKCGRALTVGVLSRVEKLADRPEIKINSQDYLKQWEDRVPYYSLVPLDEVIGKSIGLGVVSKKVKEEYEKLIKLFGGEFKILIETPLDEMSKADINSKIIQGVQALRCGKVRFNPPGFDGEYGKIEFIGMESGGEPARQKSLF